MIEKVNHGVSAELFEPSEKTNLNLIDWQFFSLLAI